MGSSALHDTSNGNKYPDFRVFIIYYYYSEPNKCHEEFLYKPKFLCSIRGIFGDMNVHRHLSLRGLSRSVLASSARSRSLNLIDHTFSGNRFTRRAGPLPGKKRCGNSNRAKILIYISKLHIFRRSCAMIIVTFPRLPFRLLTPGCRARFR